MSPVRTDAGGEAASGHVRQRRKLWHALIRSRMPFKGPLVRAYLRTMERYRSFKARPDRQSEVDGLPVPPPRLRVLVGDPDLDWFLSSGQAQIGYLSDLLRGAGQPPENMHAILDFGCGCGRMTRWWSDLVGPEIHACDYNGELVEWCNSNLPFVCARTNELRPPLSYPDRTFDFVYAFSVFTHLTVELAREWIAELRRVLKPGGLLWFTVHGANYRDRLLSEQKERFDAGEIVVWFPEIEGTNLCAAYWPEAAAQAMLGEAFGTLVHLDPQTEATVAERAQVAPHDAYLVQRG
jgi:SAM-dependent methyltransferase